MNGHQNNYPTLPKGSKILVTGVNGLIGSHVADQALQNGYKVKGTTRSIEKNKWLVETFEKNYDKGAFSMVEIKDMMKPGAFDKVMEGCTAVIHVASVLTFDPDPENVIPPTVAGIKEILKTAAKTPTVKRVVFTSSTAALRIANNGPLTVTQDTWNDEAVDIAGDPAKFVNVPEQAKGLIVYCASKTLAEKACWEYMEKEKPHFTLNTIVPNVNFGPTIHPTQPASSSGGTKAAFLGDQKAQGMVKMLGPMNYIDVRDDGKLHLAAAIFDDVVGERIWGVAGDYNHNDLIDIFAKVNPKWKDAERSDDKRDPTTYDRSRSVELLKRFGGDGFISLEESLRANLSKESSRECNML